MNVQETPLYQEGCQAHTVSVLPSIAAVLSSPQAPTEKTGASYSAEVAQLVISGLLHLQASWFEGVELEYQASREAGLSLRAYWV
jgi:hypothetical protein